MTRFRPGDQVYGDNLALKGGFAEYAVAPESVLAHKPDELTFAEASTIPQSGAISLQGLAGAVEGQRVLINGAGGGTGAFAIQVAKRRGAHVTGVDNGTKLDFMRSLGADQVIDYRTEDFTRPIEPYDLILDLSPVDRCSPIAGPLRPAAATGVSGARHEPCCAWPPSAGAPGGSPAAGSVCSPSRRGLRTSKR